MWAHLRNKQLIAIVITGFFIFITLAGCEEKASVEEMPNTSLNQKNNHNSDQSHKQSELKPATIKFVKQRTNARTWPEIKASGHINAVKLDWQLESTLPRTGSTSAYHSTLLQRFADAKGLKN